MFNSPPGMFPQCSALSAAKSIPYALDNTDARRVLRGKMALQKKLSTTPSRSLDAKKRLRRLAEPCRYVAYTTLGVHSGADIPKSTIRFASVCFLSLKKHVARSIRPVVPTNATAQHLAV